MTSSVDNVIMKIEVTVVADSQDMRTSHVIPARALNRTAVSHDFPNRD
jgi:hypothetical protein